MGEDLLSTLVGIDDCGIKGDHNILALHDMGILIQVLHSQDTIEGVVLRDAVEEIIEIVKVAVKNADNFLSIGTWPAFS